MEKVQRQLSVLAISALAAIAWLSMLSQLAIGQADPPLLLKSGAKILIATNRASNSTAHTTNAFSSRPAAALSFAVVEQASPHGEIRISEIDAKALPALFNSPSGDPQSKSVLIYVHGFNNTVDSAVYLAADVANKMDFDGHVVVFSWPSRGSFLPSDYRSDIASANASTKFLAELLSSLHGIHGIGEIHILAHSLGNDPLIKALLRFKSSAQSATSKVRELVLCSPDVSRRDFVNSVGKITSVVRGITLWVSNSDVALNLASALGRKDRAGLISLSEGPIIMKGVDTIDVSNEARLFELNHNAYRQVFGLYADVSALMKPQRSRPWEDERKNQNYKKKKTARGVYWQYFE